MTPAHPPAYEGGGNPSFPIQVFDDILVRSSVPVAPHPAHRFAREIAATLGELSLEDHAAAAASLTGTSADAWRRLIGSPHYQLLARTASGDAKAERVRPWLLVLRIDVPRLLLIDRDHTEARAFRKLDRRVVRFQRQTVTPPMLRGSLGDIFDSARRDGRALIVRREEDADEQVLEIVDARKIRAMTQCHSLSIPPALSGFFAP